MRTHVGTPFTYYIRKPSRFSKTHVPTRIKHHFFISNPLSREAIALENAGKKRKRKCAKARLDAVLFGCQQATLQPVWMRFRVPELRCSRVPICAGGRSRDCSILRSRVENGHGVIGLFQLVTKRARYCDKYQFVEKIWWTCVCVCVIYFLGACRD